MSTSPNPAIRWSPHLHFSGNCEEAFNFYEECFGAKIVMMRTYRNSAMSTEVPPEFQDKILFGMLALRNAMLFGGDLLPAHYQSPRGFAISLSVPELPEALRVFRTLAADGVVQMPLIETFWALRFGMVRDRFGIPWMLNCLNPTYQKSIGSPPAEAP